MKKLVSPVLNLISAATGLAGIVTHFIMYGWPMMKYYTLLSNIFAIVACFATAWFGFCVLFGKTQSHPRWARALKYLATCTVTMTFLVVVFVLGPMIGLPEGWSTLLFSKYMIQHHLICPVLCIVTLLFFDPKPEPKPPLHAMALIFTALYGAAAIILNAAGILDGPYPFLRVNAQPLWMSVLWFIILFGIAWLISWGLWKLAFRLNKN